MNRLISTVSASRRLMRRRTQAIVRMLVMALLVNSIGEAMLLAAATPAQINWSTTSQAAAKFFATPNAAFEQSAPSAVVANQLQQLAAFPGGLPSYINAPVIVGKYTPLAIGLYNLNSVALTPGVTPGQISAAAVYPYDLLLLGAPTGPYDGAPGSVTGFTQIGRALLQPNVNDAVLASFFKPNTTAYPKLQLDANYQLIKQTDPNFCTDLATNYSAAQGLSGADVLTADTVWVGAACNPSASEAVLGAGNPNGHCCGTNYCDTVNVPASYKNRQGVMVAWPAGYGLCNSCQTEQDGGAGQVACTAQSCCPGYSCNGNNVCVADLPMGGDCSAAGSVCATGLVCDSTTNKCAIAANGSCSASGSVCETGYYCNSSSVCVAEIPMNGDCSAAGSVCAAGLVCDSTTNKCAVAAGGDCSAAGSVCVSGLNLICDSTKTSSTYQQCVVPGQTATTAGDSCQTNDGTILLCEDNQYCTAVARTCSTCSTYAYGCQTTADCCQDLPAVKGTPGSPATATSTCIGATTGNYDGYCAMCLPKGTACATATGESCCYANSGDSNQMNCVAQNQTDATGNTGQCQPAVQAGGACYVTNDCANGLQCQKDSSSSTGNSCTATPMVTLGNSCTAGSTDLSQMCANVTSGITCGTIYDNCAGSTISGACCLIEGTPCSETSKLPNKGCCSEEDGPQYSCKEGTCQLGAQVCGGSGGGLNSTNIAAIITGSIMFVALAGIVWAKWGRVVKDFFSSWSKQDYAQADADDAALKLSSGMGTGSEVKYVDNPMFKRGKAIAGSLEQDGVTDPVPAAQTAKSATRNAAIIRAVQRAAAKASSSGMSELNAGDIIQPINGPTGEVEGYKVQGSSGDLDLVIRQDLDPENFAYIRDNLVGKQLRVSEWNTPMVVQVDHSSGTVTTGQADAATVAAAEVEVPASAPRGDVLPQVENEAGESVSTDVGAAEAAANRRAAISSALGYCVEARTQAGLGAASSVEDLLEGPGGGALQLVVGADVAAEARMTGTPLAPKPTGVAATDAVAKSAAATKVAQNVEAVIKGAATSAQLLTVTSTLAKDGGATIASLPAIAPADKAAMVDLSVINDQAIRNNAFIGGIELMTDAQLAAVKTASSVGGSSAFEDASEYDVALQEAQQDTARAAEVAAQAELAQVDDALLGR